MSVVSNARWRIGLTGGIGSGKSTVAAFLQALGMGLVDADAVSRATTAAGGAGIGPILETFGPAFIDAQGALDRERMRQTIFDDPSAKARLEGILHPIIAAEIAARARALDTACVVFDVPLLVESPRWRVQLDHVLVVDCEAQTQLQRVVLRSGWSAEMAQRVIRQQSPREQRLRAADSVIYNEGLTLADLRAQAAAWAQRFGL